MTPLPTCVDFDEFDLGHFPAQTLDGRSHFLAVLAPKAKEISIRVGIINNRCVLEVGHVRGW